jgi:ABC-type multidrug transport system fused ATPase/permease subunit
VGAVAALDPETENQLVPNQRKAREGRLVIVIAHRPSTIRAADRAYLLTAGRIVEKGSHEALLANDGTCAGFVRLQTQ